MKSAIQTQMGGCGLEKCHIFLTEHPVFFYNLSNAVL